MQLHEKIPNNVNLSQNRRLQRALEKWQPNYLKWWSEAGPADFQADDVYLRTAISVDAKGWATKLRQSVAAKTAGDSAKAIRALVTLDPARLGAQNLVSDAALAMVQCSLTPDGDALFELLRAQP